MTVLLSEVHAYGGMPALASVVQTEMLATAELSGCYIPSPLARPATLVLLSHPSSPPDDPRSLATQLLASRRKASESHAAKLPLVLLPRI